MFSVSLVPLGDAAEIIAGQSPPGESYNEIGNGIPFYQGKTEFSEMVLGSPTTWTTEPQRFADAGDILISVRAPVGPVNLATQRICIGRGLAAIKPAVDKLMPLYAFYFLRSQEAHIKGDAGAVFASINRSQIAALEIPLPPMEVQKEIVAEIEGYQKVIDGARAVVDHYVPTIRIHPDWPLLPLGDVAALRTGTTPDTSNEDYYRDGTVNFVKTGEIVNRFIERADTKLSRKAVEDYNLTVFPAGTIFMAMYGQGKTRGQVGYLSIPACTTQNAAAIIPSAEVNSLYLYSYFLGQYLNLRKHGIDGHISHLNLQYLKTFRIPVPPLATQETIVAEIEAEQALVNGNRELITRFEQKIQTTLARVWGES